MKATDLKGKWTSHYRYHGGLLTSDHVLIMEGGEKGRFTGRSVPDESGSELTVNLIFDDANRVLTGTWREKTSPHGQYQGEVFHGSVQFLLEAGDREAAGVWTGFDSKREHINTGPWRLTKKLPAKSKSTSTFSV